MTQVDFTEAVTRQLIRSRQPDGVIPADALRVLIDLTDKELIAIRNCYRINTRVKEQPGGGDDLRVQVERAAAENDDPLFAKLHERMTFICRNDRQMEAGLRGALHCLSFALKHKTT